MSRLDFSIDEGSHCGFRVKIYDVNSSVIVPSSMTYTLYDSFNTIITSGTPTSLSSESLITISNSYMLSNSGETRAETRRIIEIKAIYMSDTFGENAVKRETFQFTLTNNPYIP